MVAIDNIKEKYGNEVALVILACRVFFESASLNELKAFINSNNIAWERFMYLSKIHRVRPIVYKVVSQANIPDSIKPAIFSEQLKLTKTNFRQAIETERIILLLKKNNIEVLPYKGTHFSKQFFGDLASRESSDIDLVIRPQYLDQAISVLKKDGYQPELDDIYGHLGKTYFSYFKDYNLNKFVLGKRVFHVELHWAIVEKEIGVNAGVDSFLFRTDNNLADVNNGVKTLSGLPHFSAILIHHCFKDNLKFLKNIVDISQATKQPDIQESAGRLNENFRELGLQKPLAVSNGLSRNLFGISLTQIDTGKVSDKVINYFFNEVCSAHLSSPNNDKDRMSLWFKNTSFLQDSFIQKLKFYWVCWSFRFIPGRFDFRLVQLPHRFFFVYYFIKPFRTVAKLLRFFEKKK